MRKLLKILSSLFVAGSILLIAGTIYIYVVLLPELPAIGQLEDTQLQVPLRIYDKNGILLAEYGERRRTPVKFEAVPTDLVSALIAVEDDQFWEHMGVDFPALIAATYELLTTGHKTRGGSTLTMQVARGFFLSSEKTYRRKLNEILLALQIERVLSKEKIIELYLNQVYFGKRAYGVVAAAQTYYNQSLQDLSLAQVAMIAGLPKAPSKYNPVRNPERALIRRNHVLNRMHVLGYIGAETYTLARSEPITAKLHAVQTATDARYIAELVRAQLFEEYGDDIYKMGLRAYTTIDAKLQAVANRALRQTLLDYVRRHGYRGVIRTVAPDSISEQPVDPSLLSDEMIGHLQQAIITDVGETSARAVIHNRETIEIPFARGIDWAARYLDVEHQGKKPEKVADVLGLGDVVWVEQRDQNMWLLADIPEVQGAMVSLDSHDGAIHSLVGGFDFFKNKFNRATQARRQPGSNFKPFIYSAALEKGFTAASLVNDSPVVFDDAALEVTWRPENYSGRFYGPTRFREALVKSRNLVSIRILQAIGLRYATKYAQRFGLKKENMPYDLSLSLGSGAFTPLEIARAYAVFSNGGYLIEPYYLSRVESADGEVLFHHAPDIVCRRNRNCASAQAPRVISAQNAFIMRSIMREVVSRGTAVGAKALERNDIGGKTGTTNDQIDAWFSGFNNQLVTTSWVGFDNQKTLGRYETGGRAALPMWIKYMRVALDGMPDTIEDQPADIVMVRIDSDTGERATTDTVNSRFELFRANHVPKQRQSDRSRTHNSGMTVDQLVDDDTEMIDELF